MTIRLDWRFLSALLLLIIIGMLVLWQPWLGLSKETIQVTGNATVKAVPDEYIFTPVYEKSAATSQLAIAQVSEVGNGVVSKLKELGVKEAEIKNNVTAYDGAAMPLEKRPEPITGSIRANYQLTVTLNNFDLAKKVQEYIGTTPTLYGVSPQSTISKDARQKLMNDARQKAIVDAKAKAEATATGFDRKLGRVITVSELTGGGSIIMLDGQTSSSETRSAVPELLVGEQELDFSLQVTFAIR